MTANEHDALTIRIRATMPGRKPVSVHAESEIDGGVAGALDRLLPPLIEELRRQVVGGKP